MGMLSLTQVTCKLHSITSCLWERERHCASSVQIQRSLYLVIKLDTKPMLIHHTKSQLGCCSIGCTQSNPAQHVCTQHLSVDLEDIATFNMHFGKSHCPDIAAMHTQVTDRVEVDSRR